MIKTKCLVCCKFFITKRKRKIYCSDRCKNTSYFRRYRKRGRDEKVAIKFCVVCEKKFETHKKVQVVCSECRFSVDKYRKSAFGKYINIKSSAKCRDLAFEITLEEYAELAFEPCKYCKETKDYATGLDRVDNNSGYIKGNIVPCCGECNRMKGKIDLKDFILRCKKIVKNYN